MGTICLLLLTGLVGTILYASHTNDERERWRKQCHDLAKASNQLVEKYDRVVLASNTLFTWLTEYHPEIIKELDSPHDQSKSV